MRILMLSWEYPPHTVGGMGRHVTELSAALVDRGFDLHVVTPWLRGGMAYEHNTHGVHVHRIETLPMDGYEFTSFVYQTNHSLEQAAHQIAEEAGPFELIHAHDWLTTSVAVGLKHAWHRPMIATIHATERGRQQGHIPSTHSDQINSLEWMLSYEAWRLIACSRFMANQIETYFGAPADKIDVIPNGVRMKASPFRTERERAAFRRRFVSDNDRLVFYVGRVVYEKGVHLLIEAWPQVLASIPGTRLVIAGTGDYLERVKQRSRELGISDRVTFAGFVSDADRERLYRVADAAVFPSLYEPFGIVALEAMAAGCPVIVSSSGGLVEVVRLHETGLTVYPDSTDSLVWGILHTLQHPDWAQARAQNALREVREDYDWKHVAEATGAVYERTLADWRRASWGAELVLRK